MLSMNDSILFRLGSLERTKRRHSLLVAILLADPNLDGGPLSNAIDPFEQMREFIHFLLLKFTEGPAFYPRPRTDISNAVFAFPVPGQIFARLTSILAGEVYLKDAVDSQGFIVKALDCI